MVNRQDVDCFPNVSQYTNDRIEPTHPSSRVKSIESVPIAQKKTVRLDGRKPLKSQDVRQLH